MPILLAFSALGAYAGYAAWERYSLYGLTLEVMVLSFFVVVDFLIAVVVARAYTRDTADSEAEKLCISYYNSRS